MNEKYQIVGSKDRKEVNLELGDLVWLHLRKRTIFRVEKIQTYVTYCWSI
jgi:hypothetical protein